MKLGIDNDTTVTTTTNGVLPTSGITAREEAETWLDVTALRRLADDTSPEQVPRMVAIFIDELSEQSSLVAAAARDSNLPLLERESHVMKSSAGLFGVPRVCVSATQLNMACKIDDSSAALSLVATLLREIPPSIAALRDVCGLSERNNA